MKKFTLILLSSIALASPVFASEAKVTLQGTTPDSKVTGEGILTEEQTGLHVKLSVENVPPGKHGIHFHENGSCDEQGKAAGGHFNPNKVDHGYLPKDGDMHAHAGDMGNIEVGADGRGTLDIVMPGVTLTKGQHAVDGKAIILHEKTDDFAQPTGNSGGRIGCGVINTIETKESDGTT
jgi:superoxide dismutase, Cu-Zn family